MRAVALLVAITGSVLSHTSMHDAIVCGGAQVVRNEDETSCLIVQTLGFHTGNSDFEEN